MRRAILAAATTTVVVVGVLQYKTSSAPRRFRVAAGQPTPATPAASNPTAATSPPDTTSPPAAAPPTPSPSSTAAGPQPTSRTVDGPVVPTRYGDVQVAVTVAGGKVTDVQAPQLPFDRARSAEISQYVAPVLRGEALSAQSAQIDTISGATYTSEGYAQSLQAALTQAGL